MAEENTIRYAYMFEAKGVQRYIFSSGKLRDLAGASDLVAGLATSVKDESDEIGGLLEILEWQEPYNFSRRAGGAFCVHHSDEKELQVLRAHWRLLVMTKYPGLEFSDAIGNGKNPIAAMNDCIEKSGGIRLNYVAEVMPFGRRITKTAPLTGRPATQMLQYKEDSTEILLDVISQVQRRQSVNSNAGDGTNANVALHERIGKRFVADSGKVQFPINYGKENEEEKANGPLFPFIGDDKRIALVHADLSGLGELFANMGKKFKNADKNLELAKSIENAISAAAKNASEMLESDEKFAGEMVIPARPVLLGGDDITIIVRADLAINFTKQLLEQIEIKCKSIGENDNQKALSACAGIAISGANTPFLLLSKLAEDLCKHAKKVVKGREVKNGGRGGYASAFSFFVQNQTAFEGAKTVFSADSDAKKRIFSPCPYGVGARVKELGQKTGDELIEVANCLAKIDGGKGTVREIKTLATNDIAQAEARWQRWWEHKRKSQKVEMEALAKALGGSTDNPELSESYILFDAMTLVDLGGVK